MAEPKHGTSPIVVDETPGKKAYCQCGLSANLPYCDGSHQGTEFTPVEFTIDEKKKCALCQCKHTGNKPYCDGSHTKL